MITQEKIQTQEVRALTWKQPFAELMLHGKQETRTWKTNYRGLVLICCALKNYETEKLKETAGPVQHMRIRSIVGSDWESKLLKGSAIAIARLTDCLPMQHFEEATTFVQFRAGLWVHHYADVTPIVPVPWKGQQGWRTLNDVEKSFIIPKK